MKDKQGINIHDIMYFEVTEARKELPILNIICLALCQLLYAYFLILPYFMREGFWSPFCYMEPED